MDLYVINYIKNNPYIYKYLRENSYWYKYLNRDKNNLKILEEEMKKRYKLTTEDRIKQISHDIELIKTFIDVLK